MKSFMGGFIFQDVFSGDGVDEALHFGDLPGGDVAGVGALGEDAADVTVGVLDGAFLPGGVGVGVVDAQGGVEAFEEFLE